MITFDHTINDPAGFHARPCGAFVKEAKKYTDKITVIYGEKAIDATRLMQLMALCAKCGDTLTISVEGENEKDTAPKIKAFLTENM